VAAGAPGISSVRGVTRRELGALGEAIACGHLVQAGYEVLERNFRTRHGELDVVASDSRALIFCEVKTRVVAGDHGPFGPLVSVGHAKRRQVRRLAGQWLAQRADTPRQWSSELRFDAIGVRLDGHGRLLGLEHVEDAF
jgi:putative endonuclease